MIRDVYAGDNAYNCFPSLHTSLSTVLGIHWWRMNKKVVGGLLLAFGASWVFLSAVASRQNTEHLLAVGRATDSWALAK